MYEQERKKRKVETDDCQKDVEESNNIENRSNCIEHWVYTHDNVKRCDKEETLLELPHELWCIIFKSLYLKDLIALAGVCKAWRRVVIQAGDWKFYTLKLQTQFHLLQGQQAISAHSESKYSYKRIHQLKEQILYLRIMSKAEIIRESIAVEMDMADAPNSYDASLNRTIREIAATVGLIYLEENFVQTAKQTIETIFFNLIRRIKIFSEDKMKSEARCGRDFKGRKRAALIRNTDVRSFLREVRYLEFSPSILRSFPNIAEFFVPPTFPHSDITPSLSSSSSPSSPPPPSSNDRGNHFEDDDDDDSNMQIDYNINDNMHYYYHDDDDDDEYRDDENIEEEEEEEEEEEGKVEEEEEKEEEEEMRRREEKKGEELKKFLEYVRSKYATDKKLKEIDYQNDIFHFSYSAMAKQEGDSDFLYHYNYASTYDSSPIPEVDRLRMQRRMRSCYDTRFHPLAIHEMMKKFDDDDECITATENAIGTIAEFLYDVILNLFLLMRDLISDHRCRIARVSDLELAQSLFFVKIEKKKRRVNKKKFYFKA